MVKKKLMQNKYDEETNHSIEKDKQAEWLIKIKADCLKIPSLISITDHPHLDIYRLRYMHS